MLDNFILILGLIVIGQFMTRSKIFPSNTADVLNSFILNISLPAIILVSIPKITMSGEVIYPIITHWVLYPLSMGMILLFANIFNLRFSVKGVLVIVACLGNTAFLGIPMVKTFYGEVGIPYAILYDQIGSGLGFILAAAGFAPFYVGKKRGPIKDVLKNLLFFPPFVALILGIIFIYLPLPLTLENLFEQISATLIPCAMIAVGYQMKFKLSAQQLVPIALGLGVKLLLVPFLGIGAIKLLQLDSLALKVSLLQSAMPPMVTAGALAMSFDIEKEIAAGLVGYGLLFSFLTLPLVHFFL